MELEFEIHRAHSPTEWNDTVAELGATIFHSTYWADYQGRLGQGTPVFLLARTTGGAPVGGAVAFLHQSTHLLFRPLSRVLSMPTHPCGQRPHDNLTRRLIERLETFARQLRCRRIQLGSFYAGHSDFVPADLGYLETTRVEFLADLRQGTDPLWKSMKKDQRERVRRVERSNVELHETGQWNDLLALRRVREATREERASMGQSYDQRSDEPFYRALYDTLLSPGAARLFVARKDGAVVAAALYTVFAGRAYSMFSGSDEYGYGLGAQSAIYWLAVRTFATEGLVELNRGGLPAEAASKTHPLHGIYRFKTRLGTEPRLCRSGTKVLMPLSERVFRYIRGRSS